MESAGGPEGLEIVRKDIYQLKALVESIGSAMKDGSLLGGLAEASDTVKEQRSLVARLVDAILDYYQTLERALEAAPPERRPVLSKCLTDLDRSMRGVGLERIDPKPGEPFDDRLCEAKYFEAGSALPQGVVASCLRWGFRFGHQVLKPAQVTIAGTGFMPEESGGKTRGGRDTATEFQRLADAAKKNRG